MSHFCASRSTTYAWSRAAGGGTPAAGASVSRGVGAAAAALDGVPHGLVAATPGHGRPRGGTKAGLEPLFQTQGANPRRGSRRPVAHVEGPVIFVANHASTSTPR